MSKEQKLLLEKAWRSLQGAELLIDAQDMRNPSDYNLDSGIGEEDAMSQIAIAEEFIRCFEILHELD
jgi:hypothetical protein